MLDIKLIPLVNKAKGDISKLGKDARKSAVLAIKEQFAADLRETVMRYTGQEISDVEKIAAFDKLLQGQKDALLAEIDEGYRDDDADHYAYEAVEQAVLGPKIFDATNEFEKLLPSN